MANSRIVHSYTIKATGNVVRIGDCVLMRPFETGIPSYIGNVETMEITHKNQIKFGVRWYYRPEDSLAGRLPFHGLKELFLSDQCDFELAETIEDKCFVHSFDEYTKLQDVRTVDYFYRFEYLGETGEFRPEQVVVHCKCDMPKNPDEFMIQCDRCKDWFHPRCLNMTSEYLRTLKHFVCSECRAKDHIKG